MYRDFHYYGTFVAARLAGFSHNDATTIAHAAQYVDDSTKGLLIPKGEYGMDFDPIPTVMGLWACTFASLTELRRVWIPFHFLPGNFDPINPTRSDRSRETYLGPTQSSFLWDHFDYSDIKAKNEFRLMCLPASVLAEGIINSIIQTHKDASYRLELIGLRMHVLADTYAHMHFTGEKAWHLNDVPDHVIDMIHNKEVPYDSGEYYTPSCTYSYNSVFYLGHGRMGSIPDYPWLKYKYIPMWLSQNASEMIHDNPSNFLLAFLEMYTALKCIKAGKKFDITNPEHLDRDITRAVTSVLTAAAEYGSSVWGEDDHCEQRCQAWRDTIKNHSFGKEIVLPEEYDANQWYDDINKHQQPLQNSHYYYFNQAAIIHCSEVETILRTLYAIDLSADNLVADNEPKISLSFPLNAGWGNNLVLDENEDILYVAGIDYIMAYNLRTCAEKWRFMPDPGDRIYSSLVVRDGRIYFASSNLTARKGEVYILNADTGGLIRRSGAFPAYVFSQLDVDDKYVYICYNDKDGTTWGLAPIHKDTLVVDQAFTRQGASDSLQPSPVAIPVPEMGGIRLVVTGSITDKTLYALNADTGEKQWTYKTGGAIICKPIVMNGCIYFGSYDCFLYVLNADTGKLICKTKIPDGGQISSSPAVAGTAVIVHSFKREKSGLYHSYLTGYLMKKNQLAKQWHIPLLTSSHRTDDTQSAPVIFGDIVYAGDGSSFHAIDLYTGRIIWKKYIDPTARIMVTAVVSDYVMAVHATDGQIHIWGKPRASFTATPLTGTPPLTVQFTDTSLFAPTSWFWRFGENENTSTLQNPVHQYDSAGTFSLALNASRASDGRDTDSGWNDTRYIDNCIDTSKKIAKSTPDGHSHANPARQKKTRNG